MWCFFRDETRLTLSKGINNTIEIRVCGVFLKRKGKQTIKIKVLHVLIPLSLTIYANK